eukprot:368356-Amphidinium_carterae.1
MKGHLQRYQQRLDAAVEEVAEMKKSFADIKRTAEAQQLEAQITGIEDFEQKSGTITYFPLPTHICL